MNIRHILVPIDWSTCSRLVTGQAAGLAARLGARLTVLHVAELPPGVGTNTHVHPDGVEVSVGDALRADTEARLGPFLAEVRASGVEGAVVVRLGAVVRSILEVAEELPADLIVLGTHGRSGIARLVLGSVAESVAREAHVPVMLMRREPRPECDRGDCAWCGIEGRSPVEAHIAAETEG